MKRYFCDKCFRESPYLIDYHPVSLSGKRINEKPLSLCSACWSWAIEHRAEMIESTRKEEGK